ncbi:MAG: TIGR03545 family protein [Treponema sp.]|nr:TIGR03545 family protein [Treponema sp.]
MADKKVKSEEKAVEKKAKKEPKKVSAKKLPGLLKKKYTQKQFDKKILKKLYIEDDITYVKSLFKKTDVKGAEKLAIPIDTELTKKDVNRLKTIAKSIKANKGRVKAGSFIAVAAVIAVVGIAVTLFKNQVVKYGIKSAMQNVFAAKCDIDSVRVEIFGAQLTVNHLAQANKDEPMKNIFEFEKLDLNFNLAQLLRGRFDAENIEITGVALGTERKSSGALPSKAVAQKVDEVKDESGFYSALKDKSGTALDTAKDNLTAAFAAYNPKNVAEDIKENFKTAEKAKEVQAQVQGIVDSWKAKPAEIESQVKEFQSSAQALASLNVNNLKTPAEIQAAITKVTNAIESGKKVKSNVENVNNSIKGDANKVKSLSDELAKTVAEDKALISEKVGMYTSFNADTAKGILSGCLDSVAYETLGKYYPYLKKAVDYAGGMKNANGSSDKKSDGKEKSDKKAKKATKKTATGRLAGRDVYWKADRVPKFLIERLAASGLGLEATATDISSDMDKRGAPMVAKGSYTTEKQVHKAGLTIDARTSSTSPLIAGTYSGNNYPFTMDMTKTVSADGVPSLEGVTTINAKLTADADYSFGVDGSFGMNPVKLTAAALPNETADKLYQGAIATIKDLRVGAKVGFSPVDGLDLSISSDLDKKLMAAMQSMASTMLGEACTKALAKVKEQQAKIDEMSGGAMSKITEFTGITNSLNSSTNNVNNLNAQLEAKKQEFMNALSNAGKSAATDAAKGALKGKLPF